MEKREEMDERREAAIVAKFRHDFNPDSNTKQSQLAKFRELHTRRLQLKAKSKINKTSKGNISKDGFGDEKFLKGNVVIAEKCSDEGVSQVVDQDFGSNTKDDSLQQNHLQKGPDSKKRQRLHWGLDTKERWERKSNM